VPDPTCFFNLCLDFLMSLSMDNNSFVRFFFSLARARTRSCLVYTSKLRNSSSFCFSLTSLLSKEFSLLILYSLSTSLFRFRSAFSLCIKATLYYSIYFSIFSSCIILIINSSFVLFSCISFLFKFSFSVIESVSCLPSLFTICSYSCSN